jgi:hypothetical protein
MKLCKVLAFAGSVEMKHGVMSDIYKYRASSYDFYIRLCSSSMRATIAVTIFGDYYAMRFGYLRCGVKPSSIPFQIACGIKTQIS